MENAAPKLKIKIEKCAECNNLVRISKEAVC